MIMYHIWKRSYTCHWY